MLPEWLDPATLRWVLLAAGILLLLLLFLVIRLVRQMVLRVILGGVVAAFAVTAWAERASLADCADTCSCHVLGFDVQVPSCERR